MPFRLSEGRGTYALQWRPPERAIPSALRRVIITASLEFPMPGLPAPAKLLRVAEGVHWLRMPLPFALDHINLWLLEDDEGWVIVDTGFGNDATKQHWNQLVAENFAGRPVKRIIVTHLHPDHLGLAGWLADRFMVDVWMTQTEFLLAHAVWSARAGDPLSRLADLYRQHGLDEARARTIAERAGSYRWGVPTLPSTLRRLIEDDRITINGREWRVIIGRGHSPEHASLYCESLRLLISGDMVLPKITTNVSIAPIEPDGNPLGQFLDSLKKFANLPEDTLVLPSHGLVFYGLHARLAALAEHHEERFAIIEEVCRTPRSAADLLGHLFKREFDAHQLSFAMGEAIAHLNFLMHAHRLRRVSEDGIYRFERFERTA